MFTNMKMYYKLIVALSLTALTVLAASSPALAGGQDTKDEAKRAVKVAVKTREAMTQAVNVNDALRAELASDGRCISKAAGDVPERVPLEEILELYYYLSLDTLGNTYRATKGTSSWAAGTFRNAARGWASVQNKTLKRGLIGKAEMVMIGKKMPASDSCAVTQAWADNGYKGAWGLIENELGPGVFKKVKKSFFAAGKKVNKARLLINKTLSYDQGEQFEWLTQVRAIAIWSSASN